MTSLSLKGTGSISTLNILSFLFTLHVAMPIYINSTYLSNFTSENTVGIIYSFGSILTIGTLVLVQRYINIVGNFRVIMLFLLLEFAATLGLVYFVHAPMLIISFILSFISLTVIGFNLDVFLESFSTDDITGNLRGHFLTWANVAWLISQIGVVFILIDADYKKLYLSSALILILVTILIFSRFNKFKDPVYGKPAPFWETLREIWRNKNFLSIFSSSLLLQFFFSWMVVYTPIYLINHIGFSSRETGIIFSIMLLPFILAELPLGKIADKKLGEKEIMSLGFIIMGISTIFLSLTTYKSIVLWATLLFITRVGASMVEIMSETYFFKKIGVQNVNIISVFRSMRPIAYITAPIVATVLFSIIDIRFIFVILGLLMFYGLRFSLAIEDTR